MAKRAELEATGIALAGALRDTLISPNESDSNLEAANVVDGLFAIARALHEAENSLRIFIWLAGVIRLCRNI